jgi:hypothetical protein
MLTHGMLDRSASGLVFALALVVVSACSRAEHAVEDVARAAEERARSLIIKRDEQQLHAALLKLREITARARSATVYHVANELDEDYATIAAQASRTIASYPVRSHVSVTPSQTSALVRILTERKTYFPAGDGWTCVFQPHHILEVVSEKEKATIVICIGCGDVAFIFDDDDSIGMRSVLPPANAELTRLLVELPGESPRPSTQQRRTSR